MTMRFILSETWTSLRRNVSMIISVMLVTFISFVFIGASVLIQAQITKAKGDWYDKVEVVVWLCPDGTSQSASCSTGKAPTQQEIVDLEDVINNELGSDVSKITYMSRAEFFKNTFLKQYPNGVYEGRTLTASDMQDSLRLKLKDPTKYQVVSEVLTGRTGVEAVVDQRQIFDPVFSVLNRATVVTVVLAGVMVVVARKNETEIMRLVGASNWTIRLPFILEGVVASLLGSLLAVGALSGIVKVFVTDWLATSVQWMPFITQTTVWLTAPVLVVGAMLLAVASAVSLRRYLKV